MAAIESRVKLVVVLLIVVGGLLPLVVYWLVLGRTPNVSAEEAKQLLSESDAIVLVDVRRPEEYAASHLEAAENWPYETILALTSADAVPARFQERRLLMLCESGMLSGMAARKLWELSIRNVANVQGGMQAWIASAEKSCDVGLCRLRAASGDVWGLPFRESSWLEQWAAVLTGFVAKPVYELLALVLTVVLWRQRAADLAALCWGFLFFFVGENFCAANYLLYREQSPLLEYFHSYGMVVSFGFATFALLEGIDGRLLKLSDPHARCAALGLCPRCIKHADVPCGLRRVFLLILPALMILCLAPLCAELLTSSYNTKILGIFYNYSHPVLYQVFENRYCPGAALGLFAVSLATLAWKRNEPVLWSKLFFAAGMGALGFSLFRMVFFHAYRENLAWSGVWEEITELLFVASAAIILGLFRRGLFRRRAESATD